MPIQFTQLLSVLAVLAVVLLLEEMEMTLYSAQSHLLVVVVVERAVVEQ
jgi:hypothetical protein